MTCSTAARMLRLSLSPVRSTRNASTLTARPAAAIHSIGAAEDRDGRVEPLHGLDDDPGGDREQRDAVDERDEHGEAVEAVGAAPVGRLARQPEADPGEREAREVREHVARIGEQRQRAGEDAADDLGHHETARQQRSDADAALVGRVAMAVRMPGCGREWGDRARERGNAA